MAENQNTGIHIGHLNLRLPGDGADAAQRVAGGIGRSLAEKVPLGMQRHLGALSVRVPVAAGATEAEISDAIAEAIIGALRK